MTYKLSEHKSDCDCRQCKLVDAITTRVWSGTPLNKEDQTTILWLGSILGLEMETRNE